MTILLTPGPVQVPEEVLRAESYLTGHRTTEFRQTVRECRDMFLELAEAPHATITTGSGTLAVESMIYSYLTRKDHVLCVTYGEFGNRFAVSATKRGSHVSLLRKESGDPMKFDDIHEIMEKDSITAISLIHNETGNGTSIRNLLEITEKCKKAGLKVLVDSVSGFGLLPISLRDSGIDMFATCGHKGIASTPGIGIVAVSDYASEHLVDEDVPAYLDIRKSLKFMEKDETPYTPSTGSFNALKKALEILKKEGIGKRIERTSLLAVYVRNKLEENGFQIVGSRETYSDSVINFTVKRDAKTIVKEMKARGYIISPGMGELADKSLRIGIMGTTDQNVLSGFIEALVSTV